MHNHLYLARQPIFQRDGTILGYEFFYRNTHGQCIIDDQRHATASVLVNLLNQIGSATAFGNTIAFINTDGPLLLTNILGTLPKEKFVFELSAHMKPSGRIYDAIRYYHSLGYQFALDNASYNPHYIETFAPYFQYMSYAKFDVTQTDIEQFNFLPNPFGQMKLIAQKIEFEEMAEAYSEFAEFFQGYHLAPPYTLSHPRIDPPYIDVMELFTLLQNDAPLDEIYDVFHFQGILSLQLIQFLLSAHPQYLDQITSMYQSIERFGKNALMQWLLLIIYSKSGTKAIDEKNPNALLVNNRLEHMKKLLERVVDEPTPYQFELLHLISILSLLEKVMNVPMESLMQSIHPNQDIQDALISYTGTLGRIYAATLKIENGELNSAFSLLKNYAVSLDELSS